MSMTQNNSSSDIGFINMLTILFIALKLTGYITWSWLWVLSPLWIGFSIGMVIIVVATIIAMKLS